MAQYTLKVTDTSPDNKFGTVFDNLFKADDVVDLFTQIDEYTRSPDYDSHELLLCIKSPQNEVNVTWKEYLANGFEIDGTFYTPDEDSRNTDNYWYP
jgi:hypothetical protein